MIENTTRYFLISSHKLLSHELYISTSLKGIAESYNNSTILIFSFWFSHSKYFNLFYYFYVQLTHLDILASHFKILSSTLRNYPLFSVNTGR